MTVTETSLTAYRTLVQPKLTEKQRAVLSVFEMFPHTNFTNAEIARELGWTINRVTPRTGELRKWRTDRKGNKYPPLLEEKEKRLCTAVISPIRVSAWALVVRETLF